MARKPSREALETNLRSEEARALALYDLIRASNLTPGWRFVVGPREMRAALVHVGPTDAFDVLVFHVHELSSNGWTELELSLYRQCEHDPDFSTLLAAFEAARAWRGKHRSWLSTFNSARDDHG